MENWISVNRLLPDNSREVVVLLYSESLDYFDLDLGMYSDGMWDISSEQYSGQVTHWYDIPSIDSILKKHNSIVGKMFRAEVVYLDGKTIKDRIKGVTEDHFPKFSFDSDEVNELYEEISWDSMRHILRLKRKDGKS